MLYIRHAQKAYSNGAAKQFSLDPPLTEDGKAAAKLRFTELLERFGPPDRIIASPYLRARETAQIAADVILESTGRVVTITHNPSIGEYLGHHHKCNPDTDLHPETCIHDPIPPETWGQYSVRIRKYVNSDSESGWYISHGVVIQSIAFFHGTKIQYPSELHGIYIDGSHLITV